LVTAISAGLFKNRIALLDASITLSNMKDDPSQIAASLIIVEHGLDGALKAAREGIAAAHADGDNYSLSVWREVRRELRDKRTAVKEAPES
jgi:hypothetical protein